MTHPAASARRNKERNPSDWCPAKNCLWRIHVHNGRPDKPCPKHPVKPSAPVTEMLVGPLSGPWSPVLPGETLIDRKARDLGGYPEL